MNNRLVYIPVAYESNYSMSANITGDNKKGVNIYLKNAFVALKSVQKFNKDVDLAIVVNFELPLFYKNLFSNNNIHIYQIDFIEYKMPPDFVWSLAFFKITALKYIVEKTDYEYTLQLESDEICISNFDDMWRELEHKILMIFSPFRIDHPNRLTYSKFFHSFCGNKNQIIPKTGAGFVAGNKGLLKNFVEVSDKIYKYIKDNIDTVEKNIGDELYTSMYCALHPENVNDASPYATVYWTSTFYYVSTNYKYDAVSIIHLPAEKTKGLIAIFNYFIKNNKLPENKYIYKIMKFPKDPKIFLIKSKLRKIASKILK